MYASESIDPPITLLQFNELKNLTNQLRKQVQKSQNQAQKYRKQAHKYQRNTEANFARLFDLITTKIPLHQTLSKHTSTERSRSEAEDISTMNLSKPSESIGDSESDRDWSRLESELEERELEGKVEEIRDYSEDLKIDLIDQSSRLTGELTSPANLFPNMRIMIPGDDRNNLKKILEIHLLLCELKLKPRYRFDVLSYHVSPDIMDDFRSIPILKTDKTTKYKYLIAFILFDYPFQEVLEERVMIEANPEIFRRYV